MRVYQLSGEKEYLLPKEVYYQCVWIVRDSKRLMKVAGISFSEPEDIGILRESIDLGRWGVSDAEVENAIFQLACIEKAAEEIPFEYREVVVKSIVERGSGCDCYANEKTWKRWRQRFIYYLAKNLALY